MTPPRCKCKVSYSPRSQAENIQWCPLHKAAEDMYEALSDISLWLRETNVGVPTKLEQALKKAEGRNR